MKHVDHVAKMAAQDPDLPDYTEQGWPITFAGVVLDVRDEAARLREIANALQYTNALRGDQVRQIAQSLENGAAPTERYMTEVAGPGLPAPALLRGISLHITPPDDTITICGVRYAGALFRELGFGPIGTTLRLERREDGVLTVYTFGRDDRAALERAAAYIASNNTADSVIDVGEADQIAAALRRLAGSATP